MERLSNDPRTFKELVEADLLRAARLVIKIQDEIDPQFRIATPAGDYWIAVTLPPDEYERKVILRNVSTFMAWKLATGFTLATELYEPDAVWCAGTWRNERHACMARIARSPRPWTAANFGAVEWLLSATIDPVILDLLPAGPRSMTPKEVSACEKWLGASGKFPAVKIDTGEIGL